MVADVISNGLTQFIKKKETIKCNWSVIGNCHHGFDCQSMFILKKNVKTKRSILL